MSNCKDYCNNDFKIYEDDCVCETIDCSSCIGQIVSTNKGIKFKIGQPSKSLTELDFITGILEPDQNLTGANLAGISLVGQSLVNVILNTANLEMANLSGADLSGADLSGALLNYAVITQHPYFGSANLTDANLTGTNLTGANLTGANLTTANLTDTILLSANLSDTNLLSVTLTFDIGDMVSLQVGSTTPLNIPTGYTFTPAVPPAFPTLRRDF